MRRANGVQQCGGVERFLLHGANRHAGRHGGGANRCSGSGGGRSRRRHAISLPPPVAGDRSASLPTADGGKDCDLTGRTKSLVADGVPSVHGDEKVRSERRECRVLLNESRTQRVCCVCVDNRLCRPGEFGGASEEQNGTRGGV